MSADLVGQLRKAAVSADICASNGSYSTPTRESYVQLTGMFSEAADRIAALEAGLKPFAEGGATIPASYADDATGRFNAGAEPGSSNIKVGDFRRAAKLLQPASVTQPETSQEPRKQDE